MSAFFLQPPLYLLLIIDGDSEDEITFKKEEKESAKRKSKLKENVSAKKQKTVKDINNAILKENCFICFELVATSL